MIETMQSPFLFVPHKAGTTRNDRRFINTHLSHRAAERRKKGKAQPQTVAASPLKVPTPKYQLTQRPTSDRDSIDSSSSDGDISPPTVSALPVSTTTSEQAQTPATSVILSPTYFKDIANGLGDPFSSTLIPMTTAVRTLISFNDNLFQPWGEGIEKGFHKRAAFSNKFFKTGNQLLQDKTTGYAFLARLASMAATLTSSQQLTMAATGFKSQAYESLRQQIFTNGMHSDSLLYSQMFSLLAMEVAAHNLQAAGIHAKSLQQLIQNAPMTDCETVGEDLICSVLWHECLRGGFSLQRPAFEVDRLLDQAFMRKTLSTAESQLNARGLMPPSKTNGFKTAGLTDDVADCVGELMFMSDLNYAFESAPDLVTEDVMKAFGHRVPLISSQLLKLYNDAQDFLVAGAYPGYESEFHTAAATCLAARFWHRVATSHESVDVPPTAGFQLYRIYGTHKPILERLRQLHEAYQESGQQPQKRKLWLWILYVGSLAERANTTPEPRLRRPPDTYCHVQFLSEAKAIGLFIWPDVEDVLRMFLYSESVGVRSRLYFEDAMKMHFDG